MCPKLQKKDYAKLKQAPLITPVLRFGRGKSMVINVIFGLWEYFYTRYAH